MKYLGMFLQKVCKMLNRRLTIYISEINLYLLKYYDSNHT